MKKIIDRLHRIEGQMRGLQKILTEGGKGCEQIIIQFKAIQSAFDSCFAELLTDDLQKCLNTRDSDELKKILKLIVKQ